MATERTTDEAKQAYMDAMGNALGSVYHALWQETAWVHRKWHEYVQLFGVSKSRVELLDRAAPTLFLLVQNAMWDDILIHITRLTDAPRVNRRVTLTIQRLAPLIGDPGAAATVENLTRLALDTTDFCRDWRNRKIAHHDWNLETNATATPLQTASRDGVQLGLEAIVNVLNAVSMHYMEGSTLFDCRGSTGGAIELLYVVDVGVRAADARRARLLAGHPAPEDLLPRTI